VVGLIGLLCRQQVVSFRVCLSELYFAVSVGENTVHRIPYSGVHERVLHFVAHFGSK